MKELRSVKNWKEELRQIKEVREEQGRLWREEIEELRRK